MTLAAYQDANRYLDNDKVRFENDADALDDAISADRYVQASLFDVFGSQVTNWDIAPTGGKVQTPVIVTDIVAMLMAAYRYNKIYSLETNAADTYATRLMNMAESLLAKLRSGEMNLVEVTIISGVAFSESDFWPNDTTLNDQDQPNRKFAIDMEF